MAGQGAVLHREKPKLPSDKTRGMIWYMARAHDISDTYTNIITHKVVSQVYTWYCCYTIDYMHLKVASEATASQVERDAPSPTQYFQFRSCALQKHVAYLDESERLLAKIMKSRRCT
jgi:hypothetical protein